jgi:hypothetical protein
VQNVIRPYNENHTHSSDHRICRLSRQSQSVAGFPQSKPVGARWRIAYTVGIFGSYVGNEVPGRDVRRQRRLERNSPVFGPLAAYANDSPIGSGRIPLRPQIHVVSSHEMRNRSVPMPNRRRASVAVTSGTSGLTMNDAQLGYVTCQPARCKLAISAGRLMPTCT